MNILSEVLKAAILYRPALVGDFNCSISTLSLERGRHFKEKSRSFQFRNRRWGQQISAKIVRQTADILGKERGFRSHIDPMQKGVSLFLSYTNMTKMNSLHHMKEYPQISNFLQFESHSSKCVCTLDSFLRCFTILDSRRFLLGPGLRPGAES